MNNLLHFAAHVKERQGVLYFSDERRYAEIFPPSPASPGYLVVIGRHRFQFSTLADAADFVCEGIIVEVRHVD